MSQATIRAQIKAVLHSVNGAGVVHDYQRIINDWSQFLDAFKTNEAGIDQIRGCQIVYQGFTQEQITTCDYNRAHLFAVDWFLSVDDSSATDKEAAAMAESLAAALDTDTTLTGLAGVVDDEPAQIVTFTASIFGGVLCHYVEIQKRIIEGVTYG